jgi:hypothetical protein
VGTAQVSQKKITEINQLLSQVKKIAIPWSYHGATPDSNGEPILVTNTCAHDTVLMGLAILRLSDTDMAYFIKAEGDPLNTVLDNIEQHIHGQSRIAWIDHCNNYVPTSTSNKHRHTATQIVSKKKAMQGKLLRGTANVLHLMLLGHYPYLNTMSS